MAVPVAVWVLAAAGGNRAGANPTTRAVRILRLVADGRLIDERRLPAQPALAQRTLRRWLERVPPSRRARRGRARIVYRIERPRLLAEARQALARGGGTIALPEQATAATISLPLVKQAFRDNCETAALSMLLAAANVRVSQFELQRRLPRSGPLDPIAAAGGGLPRWGDPDRGFVGRVTGGGFGVYQRPIQKLALRYGVALTDLTGATPATIFAQLLAGRPVMVWVGLSEGPYRSWQTPSGRRITVNFGEHTVVLTGLRGDSVQLNDPLTGTRTSWTRFQFVWLWNRLGRRALAR